MQYSQEQYINSFLNNVKIIEDSFRRNVGLSKLMVSYIKKLSEELYRRYGKESKLKIMDFCGTHEYTITRFGIRSLMPDNIDLVAGPGCPVCVTPSYYIENAVKLALEGVTIYSYGDVYRLRSQKPVNGAYSLADARALGGDVKIVTSIVEAIKDAEKHGNDSIFLGIGFETVAPGYANVLLKKLLPRNLKILSLAKLTPPAMFYSIDILHEKPSESSIVGVIAPGHVSTITGAKAWVPVAENYGIPVVVAGFEPIDVLLAIAEILKQLVRCEAKVVIEYTRAVTWHGDLKAQVAMHKAFKSVDDVWRGIGYIPKSGLRPRESFEYFDAFSYFGIKELTPSDWRYDLPPGCRCAEITLGKAKPTSCPLFMKVCRPEKPIGPCMVSDEGTCSIWARFGVDSLASDIARDVGLR